MNLLAVETSTELCSVALWREGEVFAEEAMAENRHSDLLVPMLRRVLDQAGLEPRQMDAFAFGHGPGSFTGLRIACGIVQGLAFAAARPVVPVSTLAALAEQSGGDRVVAALDARMGEAYLAAYARAGNEWEEVIAPCLVGAEALPSLQGGGWTATGSGFDRHPWLREAYASATAKRIEADLPRAASIARIAARRFAQGAHVPAREAAPLYLRDKVALTSEERRKA